MPNALAYGAKVIDAEVAVSGGGGTGGGHVIEDDGTALTQRDTLNFIGFDAEDDSTNSKTQIAEHELTQDELAEIMSTPPGPSTPTDFDDLANRPTVDVTPMSEIITPVPSVGGVRRFKYSTDEQIVGEWIDGKPLYQKTIVDTTPNGTTVGTISTKYINIGASIDYGTVVDCNIQNGSEYLSATYLDNDKKGVLKTVINDNTDASHPNTIIIIASRWFNVPCYATIQYTKTTD